MDSPHESSAYSVGDMPTRPLRVKVLYTFDPDSKITCLARLQEILHVPVVEVDESSHVGVVSLPRCLQSISLASPELLPPHDNRDYAIYAYDYSEHETPLVGQGMLSTALTCTAIHNSTEAMITGRVRQNVPAIFNNGVKETLEVKLRLVPVKQHTDKTSLDSPRGGSLAKSVGFDPNAWSNVGVQAPSPQGESDILNLDLGAGRVGGEHSVLDEIFAANIPTAATQCLEDMSDAHGLADSTLAESSDFSAPFHSAPGSRAGSRAGSPMTSGDNSHMRHNSFSAGIAYSAQYRRPKSRASARNDYHPSHQQPEPSYDEYVDEDGQSRKRAKITQTDWRGRSSFGGKSGNLRVTAATAASMQMHRPVAVRPSTVGHNLEPPPRVPTPVPQANNGPCRVVRPSLGVGSRSFLRQTSTLSSDVMSDMGNMSDAIVSSPEDGSPSNSATGEGTPQDIPSSPPVFPSIHARTAYSPAPASTTWPHADSGYMSERVKPGDAWSTACSPELEATQVTRPFIKRERSSTLNVADASPFDVLTSDLGFETDLPQQDAFGFNWSGKPSSMSETQQSHQPGRVDSQLPYRAESPVDFNVNSRRGSLALPALAPAGAHHAGVKKRQSSQQPRSFYLDSEAGSPAPSESDGRPVGPRRSGSGAHRRKVIQDRLHTAIANGEMPQYCNHCGAIETPTWRRLYIKIVDGKPSALDEVEGEGEVVGVEQVEWDDKGECTKFVIRKSMKKTKDLQPGKGFSDIQLCNPCGLWFSKTRKMRPQNKWGRRSGTRRSRKTARNGEAGDMTDGFEPQSDTFFTDNFMPDDGYDEVLGAGGTGSGSEQRSTDGDETMRSRSLSDEQSRARRGGEDRDWQRYTGHAASGESTRMSPTQAFNGTAESPIELDDKTPKPTRRLLFPSPRQSSESKTLDNADLTLSPIRKSLEDEPISKAQTEFSVFKVTASDKENMPPLTEPAISDLLASPSSLFKTPQKTPLRRSPRSLAKVHDAMMQASPTPGSRKRKALGEHANNANTARPNAHDFMTSPASSRYFLRSTPTRLANTPGRSSRAEGSAGKRSQDVSPFSRQLAEMLSHDTMLGFHSPGTALTFADLPPLQSPSTQHIDWDNLEVLMSGDFVAQTEHQDSAPRE